MQLVEQGKINLDKTIADYLPEFRKETAKQDQNSGICFTARRVCRICRMNFTSMKTRK